MMTFITATPMAQPMGGHTTTPMEVHKFLPPTTTLVETPTTATPMSQPTMDGLTLTHMEAQES